VKYLLKLFLFISLLLMNGLLLAQDIHFSQHFHAQNHTNPSFNGLAPGMSRFSMNIKNQWISVRSPFNTYLASFENSWKKNRYNPSFFSTAGLVYYDVAGDADFSTIQFSPSLAYTFVLNSNFSSLFSVGIQPGIAQRSLDISKLRFDSQFNGYFFDPGLSTNEVIDHQSFVFADIGLGAHYIQFIDKNTYFGLGLSASHINKPVVSFKDSENVRLDQKTTVHGEARFYIRNTIFLPTMYFAKQGPHVEFIFGGRAIINREKKFIIDNNLLFRKNFLLGLYYRGKDALILYSGVEFQNYNIGVSYDINLSRLIPASRGRGGFELSAAYIWQKQKKNRNRDIPCPIF
jgi:type IX secretion system PorP/SprF family membrane protein